ncbi:hypothetical protein [Halorubrum pallidum]|uniref:Major facilitator superfamily (MFS) profile domain-containing protein n=1 Tax=Halorubrum pallidum TaxID=1526114 RepID=A0ABD5T6Y0_9EURY
MIADSQDRLLGLTVAAFLATLAGELLGMTLLIRIGVTSFFLAVAGLLAVMTVMLVLGVSRTSGPDMHAPILTDRVSTTPGER